MMKALRLAAGVALISVLAYGCDDRRDEVDETPVYRETPAPETPRPEVRDEGPAERTGRVIDRATKRAADAVGHGLEEAGREIQENVPEPDHRDPAD